MSMVLKNNIAANISLGELNKNISKLGQALAKVSSGMKINSAGDDSAQFAISEVMRVRIRALEQACQNVQNGNSLLRTAEDGIQQQIDLMRTIKEKVIDAANDHNSDADRKIIQKEINQYYDQIEQTAHYADFNVQKPLLPNTTFNAKSVEWDETIPAGDYVGKRVTAWIPNLTDDGKAKTVEGSDSLNLINKNDIVDESLEFLSDGRPYVENGGPFDTFTKVSTASVKELAPLTNTSAEKISTGTYYYFTGGADGDKKIISMDLSSYSTPDDLDGVAFTVTDSVSGIYTRTNTYVLSTNTSNYYAKTNVNTTPINIPESTTVPESIFPDLPISLKDYTIGTYKLNNVIDISSCSSWADVASKINSRLSNTFSVAVSADDSNKIDFTVKNTSGYATSRVNTTAITGISATGGSIAINAPSSGTVEYTHQNAGKNISTSTLSVTMSGGQNKVTSDDDGHTITPAAKATGSIPLSASDNLYYIGGNLIKFVEGSNTETKTISITDSPFSVGDSDMTKGTAPRTLVDKTVSVLEVGINSSHSFTAGSYRYRCTVNNGTLEVAALYDGSNYNGNITLSSSPYTLYFNYKTNENVTSATDTYLSTTAGVFEDKQLATDGEFSHYDIDFSQYAGNHSEEDLEEIIQELSNVNFYMSNLATYSFTDSAILGADLTNPSSNKLDLNKLRTSVANGDDIATALQNLFTSTITSKAVDGTTARVEKTSGGIKINAYSFGAANNDKGYINTSVRQNNYYQYDIDFKKLFEDNPDLTISDLFGKGFMTYCATCPSEHQPDPQWFNFYFTDNYLPSPISVEKPDIDTDEDIKDVPINLSGVEDGDWADLIQAIYDQATPVLNRINHHMYLAANLNTGVMTFYDDRTAYQNASEVRHGQDGTMYGAIIMDSYKDTSVPVTEDYYEDRIDHHNMHRADRERRLVIQDTDHADMNLTLHIPSTTLKDIFQDYAFDHKENKRNVWEYNLVLKTDRDALLGDGKTEEGALDMAINYLLDAAVMVGAQRARLEYTQDKVITQTENEMFSESTIRDADMAKEMAEYTKYNVLSQSAQAMLAQANQQGSAVLSLLQ